MTARAVRPGSLGAWWLACRPATLAVGAVPVIVGVAIAHAAGTARLLPAAAALLGALLLQVGSNLANDVFDYEKGADTSARLGPTRVTQSGLLTPRAVRRGMLVCFALALAVGSYLTVVGGLPILLLGLAGIATAIAYTGGPWPLGYHGLGELCVFVFFGPLAVCGTSLVVLGRVPLLAVVAAVPVGALATAVLVVNNVRDHAQDALAGKRTLAVRLGRRFGMIEYGALLALAYLAPVALLLFHMASWLVLLPLLTAPLAVHLARVLAREVAGPPLNRCLAGTARLLLAYGVLLALALGSGSRAG